MATMVGAVGPIAKPMSPEARKPGASFDAIVRPLAANTVMACRLGHCLELVLRSRRCYSPPRCRATRRYRAGGGCVVARELTGVTPRLAQGLHGQLLRLGETVVSDGDQSEYAGFIAPTN